MSSKKWAIILAIVVTLLGVTIALGQYRKAAAFEDRLGCVATWLEKAKALQNLQLRDPQSAGRNSHRKLTDQIEKAYACAIRGPSHSRIAPGGGGFSGNIRLCHVRQDEAERSWARHRGAIVAETG